MDYNSGFIAYNWRGVSCSEDEFIQHMKDIGLEKMPTQPLPVDNGSCCIDTYVSKWVTVKNNKIILED